MSLERLQNITSFRIDALGLITLLGSQELDLAFGSLRETPLFDALPTFAPFLGVGTFLTTPVSGFHLYNITDAILATDVSTWFGRWLSRQDLTWNSDIISVSRTQHQGQTGSVIKVLFLPVCAAGVSLTLALLTGDCWALVNILAMHLLAWLRWIRLSGLRSSLEALTRHRQQSDTLVRAICVLPSGRAVTICADRSVMISALLTNPSSSGGLVHSLFEVFGWFVLVLHILALGMTSVVNQGVAVCILAIGTLLVIRAPAHDDSGVGCLRLLKQTANNKADSRSEMYMRLRLDNGEDESLMTWGLAPHKRNIGWWSKYEGMKAANT